MRHLAAERAGAVKIAALAGGVGGARLAHGLSMGLALSGSAADLSVIVNIGDDFEHYGLRICPDLDTVCYTLAGIGSPQTGWGRQDESYRAAEAAEKLGGPAWFRLGDADLGTHLERTRRLREGHPLSQITADFCAAWGISCRVLPVSDQPVPTMVLTEDGELPFQEYFVHRQCQPVVKGFRFEGAAQSQPAPGVLEALNEADVVVFCPSNPWVSIDPILAVPGVRGALSRKPVAAVSPIISGKTVKGPAAKMYAELGIAPSALAVARHYRDLLAGFILDRMDECYIEELSRWGIIVNATQTIMAGAEGRIRLGCEVLEFCKAILNAQKESTA